MVYVSRAVLRNPNARDNVPVDGTLKTVSAWLTRNELQLPSWCTTQMAIQTWVYWLHSKVYVPWAWELVIGHLTQLNT